MTGKTAEHKKKDATFWAVVALAILALGVIGLGNELGWWQLPIPFLPVMAIAVGLGILLSAIRALSK